MTVPSKPYCTSEQVGYMVRALLKGGTDFDVSTNPTKAIVDQNITWISNHIDMQFQQAGYIVPFLELSGETWPAHQTEYLELLCATGTSAFIGGHILKPAPAMATGRSGSAGNVFQNLYDTELLKIWDRVNNRSSIRFRCQAYAQTPAELSISEPAGPNLDYMAGYINPEDTVMLADYIALRDNINSYLDEQNISWTDFYGLFSNKLNSYTYS